MDYTFFSNAAAWGSLWLIVPIASFVLILAVAAVLGKLD